MTSPSTRSHIIAAAAELHCPWQHYSLGSAGREESKPFLEVPISNAHRPLLHHRPCGAKASKRMQPLAGPSVQDLSLDNSCQGGLATSRAP